MPRARVQHRHLPRRAPWTCSRRAPPATRTGRSRAPHPTLGEAGEELDLSGAHLSYGDFEEATFQARKTIKLNGAGLAHADLSGSEIFTFNSGSSGPGAATITFAKANLAHADLSGSEITADGGYYGGTIDFTEANLASADLSGSELTAKRGGGDFGTYTTTIDFTKADLTNADLRGSEITADGEYGTIDFTEATLDNADTDGVTLAADRIIGFPQP